MKRKVLLSLLLVFILTGCTTDEDYKALQDENKKLNETNAELVQKNNQLSSWYEKLQNEYNHLLETGEETSTEAKACTVTEVYRVIEILDDEKLPTNNATYLVVDHATSDKPLIVSVPNSFLPRIQEGLNYAMTFTGNSKDYKTFPNDKFTLEKVESTTSTEGFVDPNCLG